MGRKNGSILIYILNQHGIGKGKRLVKNNKANGGTFAGYLQNIQNILGEIRRIPNLHQIHTTT